MLKRETRYRFFRLRKKSCLLVYHSEAQLAFFPSFILESSGCVPLLTLKTAPVISIKLLLTSRARRMTKRRKLKRKFHFPNFSRLLETRKSKAIFGIGIFFAILNGCVYPLLAYIFAKSFADLASLTIKRVATAALTFLGIGTYAFVASCLQNISFEYVSKVACTSFRLRWFSALLRQDAAFFDVNDISGLASSIEPNAQILKRGLGKKFGEGIQFTVCIIGGIIFALTMSWRVALLVLSIVPLVSVSALAVMKINQSQTEAQRKAYAKAGSVAYQTVSSIRTVFALNAVPEMVRMYGEATQDAYNKAVRPLLKTGLVNGAFRKTSRLVIFPFYNSVVIDHANVYFKLCDRLDAWLVYLSVLHIDPLWSFPSLHGHSQEWM